MTTTVEPRIATVSDAGRITWLCRKCQNPIRPGAGYITHNSATRIAYKTAWTRHKEAHRGELYVSLADMPDEQPAQWHPWHRTCDPHPNDSGYWIDVDRCGTLAELIHWTGHLMSKNWISDTDWDDLLLRLGKDS
jgi:hypothetical protein